MEVVFDEYIKLMESGNYIELKRELNDENAANLAEFFEELPADKQLFIFRLLTKDNAADVFSYMDSDTQEHIVKSITDNEVRNIVDELCMDDTVDFLSEAPANLVTKVLRNTDENKRELINKFLNYPENSAGSIMTIEFVQFHELMTVARAMEQLRKTGVDKETIYTCYVVDSSRKLQGVLPLRRLILADDDTIVKELMNDDIITVGTLDDQEYISHLFKKYNLIAMPVVDKENRLVGIITVDDIVDVIEQENTEDIEKMSALLPSDDEYLKTSVFELAKNRIPWLLVLMISGTISGAIMGLYDDLLAKVIALSTFVPLLMGTGGNAGSQASTLIIRGMALGEIEMKDILKVIWKEFRVGIISGAILSIVNFIRLTVMHPEQFFVNITVSVSMLCVVVVAKSIGCTLPIFAKKCGFDPAIMAGPLITTIVDSVALLIFFNIAGILV
ncbi:magnesium transporter [Tyzzerella sp. An114]|uniref:magnesium transporter n=1 Tax=Tyzzerella sp. An114 TaxID=1965545 RepID=UPI000B44B637|nr:magnesium transporter [Tyzzerella sp. An114]OUQ58560.1 magnesium transporter [Tyzzerella sp. An114]HIT72261.1 magnesium transporter [Candidatus Fimicola cottocaccae]